MLPFPGDALSKLGSDLHADDRRQVLAAYVHRFTMQHKPAWAHNPRPDGTAYPPQFASDADWLAHTWFRVRADGRLDPRAKECYSQPTWPNNPELRKSYSSPDDGAESPKVVADYVLDRQDDDRA